MRLLVLKRPLGYVFSFFGLVDLLSFVPTYLSAFVPGAQALSAVRTFRVIRLFRIFKLVSHMRQAKVIATALRLARPKIVVFLLGIFGIVVTMGSVIYLVEGEENGFTSIPRSIYWAIVTVTTVGFGDMVPRTVAGQVIASFVMILGYAIIAVPTGIVTADLAQASRQHLVGPGLPDLRRRGARPGRRPLQALRGQAVSPDVSFRTARPSLDHEHKTDAFSTALRLHARLHRWLHRGARSGSWTGSRTAIRSSSNIATR